MKARYVLTLALNEKDKQLMDDLQRKNYKRINIFRAGLKALIEKGMQNKLNQFEKEYNQQVKEIKGK